jgi:RNA polymerase sigma-70 factor (ECF subfamily)
VVNDGFVKVFKNLYRFEVKTTETLEMMLMGWMRTIMVNTAIDQLRKNSFLPEIGQIPENSWTQEDKSQSSDQRILYKELVKEIRKLPPGYRAVFNMYMIDGFTHQEIATQLNITTGTSKSNLSKARVILQRILKIGEQEAVLCSI